MALEPEFVLRAAHDTDCETDRVIDRIIDSKGITMKTIATLAALSLAAVLVGCSSTQTAPGAVGTTKSGCCAEKAAECTATKTAPGAVSAEKGCCAGKAAAECTATKAAPASAPGAVGTTKTGCCGAKTGCTAKQN